MWHFDPGDRARLNHRGGKRFPSDRIGRHSGHNDRFAVHFHDDGFSRRSARYFRNGGWGHRQRSLSQNRWSDDHGGFANGGQKFSSRRAPGFIRRAFGHEFIFEFGDKALHWPGATLAESPNRTSARDIIRT